MEDGPKRRLTANTVRRSRLTIRSPFDNSSLMLTFKMEFDGNAAVEVKNVAVHIGSGLEVHQPRHDEVRAFLDSFSDGSAATAARSAVKRLCAELGWDEADFLPRE
jgi:hypothetical protein